MIPVGYMAIHVCSRPDYLKAPNVVDIYSVGGCDSKYFINDYIQLWKHNGYGLFDSPKIIQIVARENAVDLRGTSLFYYEAHEMEFTGDAWRFFSPEPDSTVNVAPPPQKKLEGFDVVSFSMGRGPEHSPLSCNSLSEEIRTNSHCLFDTFSEAEKSLGRGEFVKCEPGPYRIFAAYSVEWP